MATIAALVKIGGDIASLQQSVDKGVQSFGRLESGLTSVGKAMAGAFTVTAIIAAGKQVLDFADQMTNLAAKTGMSTTGLQKLDLAFQASGVSLETVTASTDKLAKALIGGDKGAVSALEKLGLSVDALKQMKPEDQFLEVADAIGKIQNPTEKTYAAMTIFGKGGAQLLAGLTGNLKETTDEFEKMGLIVSQDTLEAADQLGDQLGVMGRQLLGIVANIVGPLLPALSALASLLGVVAKVVGDVIGFLVKMATTLVVGVYGGIMKMLSGLAEAATKIPIVGKHLGFMGDAAEFLGKQSAGAFNHLRDMWDGTEGAGNAAAAATPALIGLGEAQENVTKAAAAAAKQQEEFREKTAEASNGLAWMLAKLQPMPVALENMNASTRTLGSSTLDLSAAIHNTVDWNPISQGASQSLGDAAASTKTLSGTLESLVAVLDAVAGVSDNAFGRIVGGLADVLAAWDSAMKKGTELQSWIQQWQSGDRMGAATDAISFGLEAYAAIDQATAQGTRRQRVLGGALTGAKYGTMVMPGIGTAIGAGVGAVVGVFRGQSEGEKINDMRDSFISAAGGLHELNVKALEAGTSLRALLAARNVKDFEAALTDLQGKLGTFADDQAADAARLEEAITKYGFAFEELGPKFQAQKLHETATELIEDWRVLVGSGIELDTVNVRMAESMNAYLQQAMSVGAEVPAAMKPILESMASQGLLVDANGEAITDLAAAGIVFSETMTQGFDRVVSKLQELIERLQATGVEIGNIPDGSFTVQGHLVMPDVPDSIDIPVNFDMPDDYGFGGMMADGGIGRVTRPTMFIAGEAGPEDFAFSGANRRFGDGAGASMGGVERRLERLESALSERLDDLPRKMGLQMATALATAT